MTSSFDSDPNVKPTLLLDPKTRLLTGPLGKTKITPHMGKILQHLIHAKGAVVTRERLMDALYADRDDPPNEKIIDVSISHLRSACADVGARNVIGTIWGTGWLLACPVVTLTADSVPILQELLASHPNRDLVSRFKATTKAA